MVPISKFDASTMNNKACRDVEYRHFDAPILVVGREGDDDDDDGSYDYAPAA